MDLLGEGIRRLLAGQDDPEDELQVEASREIAVAVNLVIRSLSKDRQ